VTTSALFALPLLVPSLMSISEQYIIIKGHNKGLHLPNNVELSDKGCNSKSFLWNLL
jgi:hypothetical protein